jgi:hypothetical protein
MVIGGIGLIQSNLGLSIPVLTNKGGFKGVYFFFEFNVIRSTTLR